MHLELKRLSEVKISDLVALQNNPLVRRQMPLARNHFGEVECLAWVAGKEKLWEEHGYGPWAFMIDGRFAGWGGLQFEQGDADLALVLHPHYWGKGKVIYQEIIKKAFGEMGFESITVLLPPTRTRMNGMLRLGFQLDGEAVLSEKRFIRYRLHAPQKRNFIPTTIHIDLFGIRMKMRNFQPKDGQKTAELFRDTVRRVNRKDYSPEQIEAWASQNRDLDEWSSRLQRGQTFLAESEDGTLLGFIVTEPEGHIDLLYCHADHQGQGVGTRLLIKTEEQARKAGVRNLFTEASITARPFFEKHGFQVVEEQKVKREGLTFLNYRMEKYCCGQA